MVLRILFLAGADQIDVFSAEYGSISLIDKQKPAASGIHHACLLQGRKHIRGLFQNGFAALQHDADQRIIVIRILLRLLHGVFGNNARHGQDGPFLGLHDGLVCHFGALAQSLRELNRCDFFNTLQCLGKAAEKLARDDAAVSSGTFQRTLAQSSGGFIRAQEFLAVDLPDRALHRQGHICPRIPVRHRKNIERIHQLPVFFQQGGAGHDHIPQQKTVNRLKLYQKVVPPFIQSAKMSDPFIRQMRIPSTVMLTFLTFTPVMASSL